MDGVRLVGQLREEAVRIPFVRGLTYQQQRLMMVAYVDGALTAIGERSRQ